MADASQAFRGRCTNKGCQQPNEEGASFLKQGQAPTVVLKEVGGQAGPGASMIGRQTPVVRAIDKATLTRHFGNAMFTTRKAACPSHHPAALYTSASTRQPPGNFSLCRLATFRRCFSIFIRWYSVISAPLRGQSLHPVARYPTDVTAIPHSASPENHPHSDSTVHIPRKAALLFAP